MSTATRTPWWAWAWPALAWAILLMIALCRALAASLPLLAGAALIATVFAAVYHAEVVAHRIGEPFGTLVLAVAVTVIEVALIVSVMIAAPAEKAGLARDTVFAAVMIVCNGIVGLCLLWRRRAPSRAGISAPGRERRSGRAGRAHHPHAGSCRTSRRPRPVRLFSTSQLIFAGIVSLVLYGSFVFVQTVRHRDYFLPLEARRRGSACAAALQQTAAHQRRPAGRRPGRRCRPCQISDADAGDRHRLARRAKGRRRHRHRGAGAAARRSGGAAGGPRQPVADQPEPGVGLGAREHRPDHPGGCASSRSCLASRSSSVWAPRTRCCWR